jgi:hypothetical protein
VLRLRVRIIWVQISDGVNRDVLHALSWAPRGKQTGTGRFGGWSGGCTVVGSRHFRILTWAGTDASRFGVGGSRVKLNDDWGVGIGTFKELF